MKRFAGLFGLSAFLFTTTNVLAQPTLLTVDEWGRGTNGNQVLNSSLMFDPSGGLLNWKVLVYTLPFQGVVGDVLMTDPLEPGNPILDVLRFDNQQHLIFYSDSIDGYESPADTPGPPNPFYPNIIFIQEQEAEGQVQWGDYAPLAGQPGYDAGNPLRSFKFISDIPEPRTLPLLLPGAAVVLIRRFRRTRSPSDPVGRESNRSA
jgi:hypothetical protein